MALLGVRTPVSRPSRARGLKQLKAAMYLYPLQSRPSRARGLKPFLSICIDPAPQSRPSRARGLKRLLGVLSAYLIQVAPLAGAWIETYSMPHTFM